MIMCNTRTKYWRRNYWTCLRASYSCYNGKKQARLSTAAMAKLLDDKVMALVVITTKKKKSCLRPQHPTSVLNRNGCTNRD